MGGSLNENHDTSDVEKERRRWSGKTRMGGEAAATQFIPSPASPDQHTHTRILALWWWSSLFGQQRDAQTQEGRQLTAAKTGVTHYHSPRVRYQLNKLSFAGNRNNPGGNRQRGVNSSPG